MNKMEDAPKDGTRIIVLCEHYLFSNFRWRKVNPVWKDCWFDGDEWQEFCGNFTTKSTGRILPLGWAPLPPVGVIL